MHARAFGFISKEEGEEKWPSLRGHESDRIEEMEKEMKDDMDKENGDMDQEKGITGNMIFG